jgi:hypothetical protein
MYIPLRLFGTPLAIDSLTAKRVRISYARALIEVDLSQALCKEVPVTLRNSSKIIQSIHFKHIPSYCEFCKSFGHSRGGCKVATKYQIVETQPTLEGEISPRHLALMET